ncbi:TPA: zinc-ribbon domain-containing protein [Listeria monocytogenes]|nr:zinc-ribbon domain-containing protein [Listeria monocytogenes]EAG7975816.1 zinc-ribbon domain-containing protein [Listeria monocytogenes]EAG9523945.1 zinc-ribbon domain-containing protein [Listeria monocytogenes]EAH1215456.1 zinc-ribbon domain-containing protein [Listeria monocytogenes]HDU0014431.1 zinc-ribbon domain-containing protein [Listeria monocytogenes]
MYCPKCGHALDNHENQCPNCLTPIIYQSNNNGKAQKAGEIMEESGKLMSGCGCLMTLLITIHVIVILIIMFL